MALAFLLIVLFVVALMIAFFIFPPSRWLAWFYGENKNDRKQL